tara:strand:- start:386 stop:508 length:123 start_codon:yes stop_codon:yes gene_type:complete
VHRYPRDLGRGVWAEKITAMCLRDDVDVNERLIALNQEAT